MARGATLESLLIGFRVKCKLSLNVASNAQARDSQVKRLQDTQVRLWEDFTWPHMLVKRDVQAQAGQRYYSLPSDLDIDRIVKVSVFTGGVWEPMGAGIGDCELTTYNSDLDSRAWPPRKWGFYEDGSVEIWPIPEQNAETDTREGYIRFEGVKTLAPLVSDDDVCDLDDQLIILYAAAEQLASDGSKAASYIAGLADRRYRKLTGNLTQPRRHAMFGINRRPAARQPQIFHYRPPSTP